MKSFELKGKCILLTGADGFLGKHIKSALVGEGAYVICTDVRASSTAEELDISNNDNIDEYLKIISAAGRKIDGLVNNAALSFKGLNISDEQFDKTMSVNIRGTCNMVVKLKPLMNKNSSIVNVSSIFGSMVPEFSNYEGNEELYSNVSYGASKAAIEQITRYYAKLYGPDMRINSISPGGIYQNHSKDFVSKYSRNVALGRMGEVDEIVNGILFLLSPLSSYITGHNLVISGGAGL